MVKASVSVHAVAVASNVTSMIGAVRISGERSLTAAGRQPAVHHYRRRPGRRLTCVQTQLKLCLYDLFVLVNKNTEVFCLLTLI